MYDVHASRSLNTNYTNTGSNVMFVSVAYSTSTGGNTLTAYSDGILIVGGTNSYITGQSYITFPVGAGKIYKVNNVNPGSVTTWTECR